MHAFVPRLRLENFFRRLVVHIEPARQIWGIMEDSNPWLLIGPQPVAFVGEMGIPRKFLLDETIKEYTFSAI